MAFPLEGGEPIVYKLGERWGPERAAPLDLEIDPRRWPCMVAHRGTKALGIRVQVTVLGHLKEEIRTPAPVAYSYMRLQEEKICSRTHVQVKHNEKSRDASSGWRRAKLEEAESVTERSFFNKSSNSPERLS